MMTRPSWLTIALAASAGFLCGVLLVAVLGGAKGPSRTVTRTVARTVARTVTSPVADPGAPTPQEIPDVVGLPLDRARAVLEGAGFDVEVQHDGPFPIIVESNWTVVGQLPAAGLEIDPGAPVRLQVEKD